MTCIFLGIGVFRRVRVQPTAMDLAGESLDMDRGEGAGSAAPQLGPLGLDRAVVLFPGVLRKRLDPTQAFLFLALVVLRTQTCLLALFHANLTSPHPLQPAA
jgi:hypothetical protein